MTRYEQEEFFDFGYENTNGASNVRVRLNPKDFGLRSDYHLSD